jgi:hypothetical protein
MDAGFLFGEVAHQLQRAVKLTAELLENDLVCIELVQDVLDVLL